MNEEDREIYCWQTYEGGPLMMKDREVRKLQLVAREAVLCELLEDSYFRNVWNEGSRKVIDLLHKEIIQEMKSLGLTEDCRLKATTVSEPSVQEVK